MNLYICVDLSFKLKLNKICQMNLDLLKILLKNIN